jgi:predicted nucleic acid-binding protein
MKLVNMSDLVCIDTMILIWGLKKKAQPGQEIMIQAAEKLLDELEHTSTKVIIPSPVIGELLAPIPQNEHSNFLSLLGKNMIIVPYDMKAAARCAHILRTNTDKGVYEEIKQEEPTITRNHLKVDFMIVAIAVANQANLIYSNDSHIKKFANGFIKTQTLSNHPTQMGLFGSTPTPQTHEDE